MCGCVRITGKVCLEEFAGSPQNVKSASKSLVKRVLAKIRQLGHLCVFDSVGPRVEEFAFAS